MKRLLPLLVFLFITPSFLIAQAIEVKVVETESGFGLTRGGEPYYIKGAGGHGQLDELLYLGGNSIRTWSAENAQEILDAAHEKGLTVMFGLWVQHERHGFDYNDEVAVQKQLDRFTAVVERYKDHPALLMWGVGNEVDLFYSNTKVWDAIQGICSMIHEIDPKHPTSTVTAGLDSNEVHEINTRVPDLDIYGVNTYGDLWKVPGNIRKFGWKGPYIISEWGPNGHWEVAKTKWGAPIEQTSTEKAASYNKRYTEYIASDTGKCLGSYVFLWGQKQETTATWYGLFSAEGKATEPLDKLYLAWQKKDPENFSPSVDTLLLDGRSGLDNIYLKSEDKYEATLAFSDRDSKRVKVEWYVYTESVAQSSGGDFEEAIPPVLGVLSRRRDHSVRIRAPKEEGAYRLFVYVTDQEDRVAYANIPFYVLPRTKEDPPSRPVRFKKQTLDINTQP